MNKQFKIMFVCYGNICRSPMAEFIFKHLAEQRDIADRFYVRSSATSSENIHNGVGSPVYPESREELAKHGIGCDGKQAAQLSLDDYGNYDLFIGMDSNNITDMRRILGGDPDGKVHKLMEYTARGGDVADPWYTRCFDVSYRDIYDGCCALLDALQKDIK